MKNLLLLVALSLSLIIVACNSNVEHDEKLEKYDMYGIVDFIFKDRSTIELDNSTWSSKSGLIPGEIESGTAYNLIFNNETKFLFENGNKATLDDVQEQLHIGIYLNENDEAKEIVILNK